MNSLLKNRLNLKRLEILIQKEVNNNFGHCPNSEYLDKLLAERNEISAQVKANDPEWFKIYEDYEYREQCKKLPIF
jgi:hypothetical protein